MDMRGWRGRVVMSAEHMIWALCCIAACSGAQPSSPGRAAPGITHPSEPAETPQAPQTTAPTERQGAAPAQPRGRSTAEAERGADHPPDTRTTRTTRTTIDTAATQPSAQQTGGEPILDPLAAPKRSSARPAPGARMRSIHPNAGGSQCVEMYGSCAPGVDVLCTSNAFVLACGETGQLPSSGEWLMCVCP